MAPKRSVTSEKIVEAAAQLFARKGYHGTSTRKIAHLARVSENTLFRHFERKEELFCSVLRTNTESLLAQWNVLSRPGEGGTLEVVLPKVLGLLADIVSRNPEVLRLIAVAFLELRGKAETLCRELLSPLFSEISQSLAKGAAIAKIPEVDSSLLTASLMSMVLMHPQLLNLNDKEDRVNLDNRGAVVEYSKFWLNMLTARSSAQPPIQTA